MRRIQIYLTEHQRAEIAAIAHQRGRHQSEVIREALNQFLEQKSRHGRQAILREPAGIWRDRSDLTHLAALRGECDRD